MQLVPMFDRILIKKARMSESKGGIIIPEIAQNTSARADNAVVVAVGNGKRLNSGATAEPCVKAGDAIIFDKNRGFPVIVDGQDLTMIFEDDILGVFR